MNGCSPISSRYRKLPCHCVIFWGFLPMLSDSSHHSKRAQQAMLLGAFRVRAFAPMLGNGDYSFRGNQIFAESRHVFSAPYRRSSHSGSSMPTKSIHISTPKKIAIIPRPTTIESSPRRTLINVRRMPQSLLWQFALLIALNPIYENHRSAANGSPARALVNSSFSSEQSRSPLA
jgi:hypothetical protein